MDRMNRNKKTEPGRVVPSQPRLQLPRVATCAARSPAMAREEVLWPGEHREECASFGSLRHWSKDIWTQFVTRNARNPLNIEHALSRDHLPLEDRLRRQVQRAGDGTSPACGVTCPSQC